MTNEKSVLALTNRQNHHHSTRISILNFLHLCNMWLGQFIILKVYLSVGEKCYAAGRDCLYLHGTNRAKQCAA